MKRISVEFKKVHDTEKYVPLAGTYIVPAFFFCYKENRKAKDSERRKKVCRL
jgi:hypothetical protein